MISAYGFLMLRYRRTGNPFGRRARWWAITIIVLTALISTGVGLAAVAAGNHVLAAFVGLILPERPLAGGGDGPGQPPARQRVAPATGRLDHAPAPPPRRGHG